MFKVSIPSAGRSPEGALLERTRIRVSCRA